mmetsp:Transcript_17121/g.51246  ORF Transcript_17121/g.51246 Transcript_17121/m.51246 type:complete len:334 (-) Transcript_17121:255-1256(-)|eukprot:CAMPEP_0206146968 /NCGR_PEP_ID=MMETSP1473-20131121/32007_1 /ASSEMBLY_ACC=CAM_ASM_001109 /TAXON_ID=1461547 /ORGANISM="Stichococcus sp, Strain RCC1054" /LENGTH=333 /DNA_ID=CAMNT_0053543721 /DNA_START=276 /DNA_END=1277 /DNA_ORIENTATION=-
MGGSKHSKNAGTMGSESQTYHERKAMGHGTIRERLGKDAAGNFDDCALTLRTVVDPVATPEGVLFERQAILENLLAQKKANKRKLVAWEQQQEGLLREAEEKKAVDAQAEVAAFDRQNHAGASEALAGALREAIKEGAAELMREKRVVSGAVNIRTNKEKMKEVRSYWGPSMVPEARDLLDKPDVNTYCPATGKKLRLKDLVSVKFTRLQDEGGAKPDPAMRKAGAQEARFCDPITKDVFTNASSLVLLKSTGDVLLKQTYEKCVKPDGIFDGRKIAAKDVIDLKSGGTGFAHHDKERTEASKHWTLGPGSGKQDLRGQAASGRSYGGLSQMN